MLNYNHLKKILFQFQPETAHHLAESGLKTMQFVNPLYNYFVDRNFINDEKLRQHILGMEFTNPVGLGAGFDKNATVTKSMKGLGFGYTEVGTITPKPQDGNPKPRLFRFPQQESLQNAMGFNNDGSEEILNRLKKIYPFDIPVGANIGKNKLTSQDKALDDYRVLINTFKDYSDYLVINISSPNTPNLRDLQNESFIKELFEMSQELTKRPIFLKIAPDMDSDVAINLCNTAVSSGASGVIATNTTIDYSLLPNPKDFGGISGAVLEDKSYKIFCEISKELFGKTILVSVGGINSAQGAYKRLKAGASLVQIYSSLVFKGPSLVRDINLGILELMRQDGYNHISQVIGSDIRND